MTRTSTNYRSKSRVNRPRDAAFSLPRARPSLSLWSQDALVSRWNAARAEVDYEERLEAEEAAAPSLELLEKNKRKRIHEWREGVSTAEAERNTNFAALGGGVADWRERAKRGRQRKE